MSCVLEARRFGHRVGSLKGRALDTGRRLLRRDGPDGVNLRDIASEAGAGLGSLYYHFADKEALLAQLALEGFAELHEDLRAARAEPGRVTPARACALAFLSFIRREPNLYSLMFRERILGGYEAVRIAAEQAFATFEAAVEDSGLATGGDLRPVSMALWAMVRGASCMALSGAGGPDLDQPKMFADIFDGLTLLMNRGPDATPQQGSSET